MPPDQAKEQIPDKHSEVVKLSDEQAKQYRKQGAQIIFQDKAWYDQRRLGYQLAGNSFSPVAITITDDKFLTVTLLGANQQTAQIWGAYLANPNEVKLRSGNFWFTKVGDNVYDPKQNPTPFVISFAPSASGASIFGVLKSRKFRRQLAKLGVNC